METALEKLIRESEERQVKANTPPYRDSDIKAAQEASMSLEPRFREMVKRTLEYCEKNPRFDLLRGDLEKIAEGKA